MALTDGRTKRIFVSDIHMGDETSHNPPEHLHPWAWLSEERAKKFARFLELISRDPQVKEIIILGDLFDEWICPTELNPVGQPDQFHKIADAEQNTQVIQGLRDIAQHDEIDLIYVPGNHDMLITQDIIEDIIPKITFLHDPDYPGKGLFEADGIAAEHGSWYCLFNAPDWYSQSDHMLPEGFFISRAAAHRQADTGEHMDYLKMLAEAIGSIIDKDAFGKLVYDTVVEGTGPYADKWIKMGGIDNFIEPVQLKAPSEWYANLTDQWKIHMSQMHDNVHWLLAASGDASGSLRIAAGLQYFRKPNKADIVIFGHTHKKDILGANWFPKEKEVVKLTRERGPRLAERRYPISPGPWKYIYANSGAWIDSAQTCNFVETQLDESARKHYVRLMQCDEPHGEPEITKASECFKKV